MIGNILASGSAAANLPPACQPLANWLQLLSHPAPATSTTTQRFRWNEMEWTAREQAAIEVFENYLGNRLTFTQLGICLNQVPEYRESFFNTLNAKFYQASVAHLGRGHSLALQRLSRALSTRMRERNFLLFNLTGHFGAHSPTELPAGFHRRTGSIFMDLQLIAPSDWMIIFIHESLHALDSTLAAAELFFVRPEFGPRAASFARQTRDPDALSIAQQAELESWLISGLDRGLWGEYRAWLLTFQLYQQGISEGLWSPSPWMEHVLSERGRDESLDRFTYRLLDQRSSNPTNGIFSHSLIQNALLRIRESVRTGVRPLPGLGNLADFLRE